MHKKPRFCKKLDENKDWAPLILRVVIGILFIAHGAGKLWGAPGFEAWSGMLAGMGLGLFFAYLVAIVELAGGALLILGMKTRMATIPLAIVMLVAIITVKAKNGFMAGELDYAFLAILVSLFFSGAGKWSVDGWCTQKHSTEAA